MNQEEGFSSDLGTDLDALNDETFGSGAIEDDWETSHAKTLEAESGTSVPSKSQIRLTEEEINALPSSLSNLTLKQLWPSSNEIKSIWASPQTPAVGDVFPFPQDHTAGPAHHKHPQLIPQQQSQQYDVPAPKMLFAEDLEKELTSENTASSVTSMPAPPLEVMQPRPYPQHIPLPYLPPYLPLRGRVQFPPPVGHPQHHPQGVWPPPPMGLPLPHAVPRHGMPLHFPGTRPPPPGFAVRLQSMPRGPYPHGHRLPHTHHEVHDPWRMAPPSEHTSSRYSELLCDLKPDWSGFMTAKEKEWVLKIQLIQLQSSDPSNDDYYYQKFMQKKLSSERQAIEAKSTSLLLLPHITHENREYKPVEFAGTLGKLSVQSISAPRKILEAKVVADSDKDAERFSGREAKKRQVLITIEKLYSIVLQMEELERKSSQMVGEQRERLLEKKDQLCVQLVAMLKMKDESGDQVFQMIMSYRKGRRLLNRAITVLPDHKALEALLLLLKNLAVALKRDSAEPVLEECLVSSCAVVRGLLLSQLVDCMEAVLDQIVGGAHLSIIQSKFGLYVLNALLEQGNNLSSDTTSHLKQHWSTLCAKLHDLLYPYRNELPTETGAVHTFGALTSVITTVRQSV